MNKKYAQWMLASVFGLSSLHLSADAQTNTKTDTTQKQNIHAVILAGKTENYHQTSINKAYDAFIQTGTNTNNIYILNDKPQNNNRQELRATKANIHQTLNTIKQHLGAQDILLLYVTGHGAKTTTETTSAYIPLEDHEKLTITELRNLTEAFANNTGLLIFDQCYGGAFSTYFTQQNVVSIAAGQPHEESYANTFPLQFFTAWLTGVGDTNNDKNISALEAFEHAKKFDIHTQMYAQHPTIHNPKLANTLIIHSTQ